MLGQVKRVSVAGERNDENLRSRDALLEHDVRERTDQLLLAAAEVDYQEDIIRQRGESIQHINREVVQVRDLFQDMAIHVSRQGEVLDHIEANVTNAQDQTAAATQQLSRAAGRQPGSRQTLVCFGLLVFLILVGVAMLRSITLVSYRTSFLEVVQA